MTRRVENRIAPMPDGMAAFVAEPATGGYTADRRTGCLKKTNIRPIWTLGARPPGFAAARKPSKRAVWKTPGPRKDPQKSETPEPKSRVFVGSVILHGMPEGWPLEKKMEFKG
jgi:hypothetical protein